MVSGSTSVPCLYIANWSAFAIIFFFPFIFVHRIEKREKYSRRRAHHDEADIDYINERNMKFNQKLARFYDPFTSEIKQNLERGTAI